MHPSPISYRRAVLTAVAVITTTLLPVLMAATLGGDIRDELGFGSAELGAAVAAFWASATVTSIPAGRLVDRIGGGAGVRLSGALGAACALGIALGAHSYPVLVALLALGGTAPALAGPGMSTLVSRQMRGDREGSVLAFQQSGPPAATVLAGVALPLVAAPLGWRTAFALAAGAVVVAVLSVSSEECEEPVVNGGQVGGPPSAAAPDAPGNEVVDVWSGMRTKSHPPASVLAISSGLGAAAASAGITFFVPFATENGIGDGAAGVLLAVAAGLAIAVRIGLGLRADGTDADRLPPITLLLLFGAAGYLVLATGATAAVVLGAVVALGVGWGWAGLVLLATVELNREAPGSAVGMVKSGTFAGALAGPLLAGVLVEAASLEAVWIACALLAAGGAAVIARPGPRPRAARTTPGARAPAA